MSAAASDASPSVSRLVDPAPEPVSGTRRVTSVQLLGPKGELVIDHAGREYRLRLTQNGKLILTA
jgi:hemin uptake protein HemP